MTKDEVLAAVNDAFRTVPRPEAFLPGTCACDECAEHEEVLAAHTPETIGMAELGNPGWDPMCFVTEAAFAYYLPALVRLAAEDDYLGQLLFHANVPGRIEALGPAQARALLAAFWWLAETRLEEHGCGDDAHLLDEAVRRLEVRLAHA